MGETGRTLKKRISEHKQAVKRCDQNNGIAVYVMSKGHNHQLGGSQCEDLGDGLLEEKSARSHQDSETAEHDELGLRHDIE